LPVDKAILPFDAAAVIGNIPVLRAVLRGINGDIRVVFFAGDTRSRDIALTLYVRQSSLSCRCRRHPQGYDVPG
jgi:hypothetical protein